MLDVMPDAYSVLADGCGGLLRSLRPPCALNLREHVLISDLLTSASPSPSHWESSVAARVTMIRMRDSSARM